MSKNIVSLYEINAISAISNTFDSVQVVLFLYKTEDTYVVQKYEIVFNYWTKRSKSHSIYPYDDHR